MANEFIVKNGLIVSGSLNASESIFAQNIENVVNLTVNTPRTTAAKTTVESVTFENGTVYNVNFTLGTSVSNATLNGVNIQLGTTNVSTTTLSTGASPVVIPMRYNSSTNKLNIYGSHRTADSTEDYNLRWENSVQAGEQITQRKIIMEGVDGKFYPLTIGNTTATNKTVSTQEFRLDGTILVYNTTTTIAANGIFTNVYVSEYLTTTNYTFNQSSGFIAYRSVYLVGTVNSNGNFVLDNTTLTSWLTQTLPTTDDGKVYIYLGITNNTTTAFRLDAIHPIYQYKNGRLQLYSGYSTFSDLATTSNSTDLLNRNGLLVTDNWNDFYTDNTLRVASAHNFTPGINNAPPDVYEYGGLLTYRRTLNEAFQMYFPENAINSTTNSRKLHYRSGWNGTWSDWKTVVDMVGDTCTLFFGTSAKLKIQGSSGYGSPSEASIDLLGDADNNQIRGYRIKTYAPDWNGQDFIIERYSNDFGYQLVGRIPKNTYDLEWQGTIVQGLSDSRVKTNVVSMTGGLDKIDQIRPVTFDWTPVENVSDREGADFGFIAQELEEVLPEVVHTRGDGYKTVMYEKVVPVLTQAIKEQQAMIENLKAEIELLKNK
jgi:hypothetical protein